MKQYEAVITIMENNGGFATLGFLYQNVLKLPGCEWKTKTPFASIRRIVQDERFFFKIKPGLWALNSYKHLLPAEMLPSKKAKPEETEFTHSYYQGLLVQLGNLKKFQTFIPSQDKNRIFLGTQKLSDITSLSSMYQFSYSETVQKASTIDVLWFNERRMPSSLFEVEHTTDIKNSLIKFVELRDFRTDMFIVADKVRERLFEEILKLSVFESIKKFVRFMSYDDLSEYHSNISKLVALEERFYKLH
jgi:hypothetical protein